MKNIRYHFRTKNSDEAWQENEIELEDEKKFEKFVKETIPNKEFEILQIDWNMTLAGMKAKVEELKSNPRVSDFWIDENLFNTDRQNSIWYSGTVLSFTIDGRYEYSCRAIGDIEISIGEDDIREQMECVSRLTEFLEEHNITKDSDITKALDTGDLYFSNNNWFQDEVYDTFEEEYLSEFEYDTSDGPFLTDLDYLFQCIDEYSIGLVADKLDTLDSLEEFTLLHCDGDNSFGVGLVFPNESPENEEDKFTLWDYHNHFYPNETDLGTFIREYEGKLYVENNGYKLNTTHKALQNFFNFTCEKFDIKNVLFKSMKEEDIKDDVFKKLPIGTIIVVTPPKQNEE